MATILGTWAAYVLARMGRSKGFALYIGLVSAPLVIPEVVLGGPAFDRACLDGGLVAGLYLVAGRCGDRLLPVRSGLYHLAGGSVFARTLGSQARDQRVGDPADLVIGILLWSPAACRYAASVAPD
uniref:Uncharacterized protein n=1 Tax=Panagrolaimus superbus TaxID=310955 RepID=A0A914ZBW5_9BILA